ncbi:unnamed protein product [Boreogadus saida]
MGCDLGDMQVPRLTRRLPGGLLGCSVVQISQHRRAREVHCSSNESLEGDTEGAHDHPSTAAAHPGVRFGSSVSAMWIHVEPKWLTLLKLVHSDVPPPPTPPLPSPRGAFNSGRVSSWLGLKEKPVSTYKEEKGERHKIRALAVLDAGAFWITRCHSAMQGMLENAFCCASLPVPCPALARPQHRRHGSSEGHELRTLEASGRGVSQLRLLFPSAVMSSAMTVFGGIQHTPQSISSTPTALLRHRRLTLQCHYEMTRLTEVSAGQSNQWDFCPAGKGSWYTEPGKKHFAQPLFALRLDSCCSPTLFL